MAFKALNYLYGRYLNMKKAHWFIIFLLFAISCLDEPDCFRLNNNVIGIAFKKMYDGKADTVALIGITAMDAIDTVFSKFTFTNGAYVPLDFFDNQTALTLEGLYQTNHLTVGYDVRTQFVSDDCGARYVLSDLALQANDYDSIRLVSTTPSSSEAGVHVEVYRCPRTHLMKFAFRQLQGDASVALTPKIVQITPDYTAPIFVDTTLSYVNLPLNPATGTVRFDFSFRDYGSNFVEVQYESNTWNYGEKYCASKNLRLYHDLAVNGKGVGFDFDSVLVVRDSLQDPPLTNLIAYRCPQTNLVRISFRTSSAPVRADSLDLIRIIDDNSNVYYENTKLALFTLPLSTGSSVTEKEFTFELKDGTVKKLKLRYTPVVETVFGACGEQTTLTALTIVPYGSGFDFSTSPAARASATTFPVQTNFEIIP